MVLALAPEKIYKFVCRFLYKKCGIIDINPLEKIYWAYDKKSFFIMLARHEGMSILLCHEVIPLDRIDEAAFLFERCRRVEIKDMFSTIARIGGENEKK